MGWTPETDQSNQDYLRRVIFETFYAKSKQGVEVKGEVVVKKSKKKVVKQTKGIVVIDGEQLEERLVAVIFV